MANELAILIALMCPQPTLKAKVQCVGSIRACVENPKIVVKKGNHKVFRCAKEVASKSKSKKEK